MKKILLICLLWLAAGPVGAQTNVLEKGLEDRSLDDSELSRKYIVPSRIIPLPGDESRGVTNAEALLKSFDGQLSTTTGDFCLMTTSEGRRASVLLDYGKELYGGIEIASPMRPSLLPIRVRVRMGESVSETMSDAESRTDFECPMATATNEHTMRDFTLEVPWLGSVEIGNSGFRFVRIDLLDEDAVLPVKSVRAVLRYRDIPYLGSFCCDNERLNAVWETGAYTVHLNMQNYLWDGIKRDRLVWLGDMHPEVMTIQSVFGDNPVVRKSLDFARDNTPLPEWMNTISAYSMWWILIHRDLYLYQGDLDYLKGQQTYMKALLRQLMASTDGPKEKMENGFRLLDWPTSRSPEIIHAGYQALLVMCMEAGVQVGEWIGDTEMRRECADALTLFRTYVPPHLGNKQAASLLALAGLVDPAEVSRSVVAAGGPEGFSTFYGYYMLEALAQGGLHTEAMEIISHYWGAMLDLGATTFWENLDWNHVANAARIDEIVPAGKFDIHACSGDFCYLGLRHSFCHGWASGPTPWLSRYVLGVVPVEPGCRVVRVEPHLGGLKWVEGTFPTPHGVIEIRHEKGADGKIVTKIKAPKGVKVIR